MWATLLFPLRHLVGVKFNDITVLFVITIKINKTMQNCMNSLVKSLKIINIIP